MGWQETLGLSPGQTEPSTATLTSRLTHQFMHTFTHSFIASFIHSTISGDLQFDKPEFESRASLPAQPHVPCDSAKILTCFGLYFPHLGNGFHNKQKLLQRVIRGPYKILYVKHSAQCSSKCAIKMDSLIKKRCGWTCVHSNAESWGCRTQ